MLKSKYYKSNFSKIMKDKQIEKLIKGRKKDRLKGWSSFLPRTTYRKTF
jgi:hypothetical protein